MYLKQMEADKVASNFDLRFLFWSRRKWQGLRALYLRMETATRFQPPFQLVTTPSPTIKEGCFDDGINMIAVSPHSGIKSTVKFKRRNIVLLFFSFFFF
jgi:hypothetical protein